MAQEIRQHLDVSLRRGNLPAVLLLLAVASAALAVATSRPFAVVQSQIAVDRSKVDAARRRLDPNVETEASLRRLPRIGAVMAQEIVKTRSGPGGGFKTLADLDRVPRIGSVTLTRLAPYLTISPPDAVETEPLDDE